jgi:hypothetical protein
VTDKKKRVGFNLGISADVFLEIDEIWPDGDAPENPTAEDVIKVIKACGGAARVIRDWDLDAQLDLDVDGIQCR